MQLQKDIESLKEGGVQIAAISYDSVDILAKFGKQSKIRFPLLSDPKSETIEAYGIRNKQAKGSRIDGVPHPGTFLIDREGVIREKLFFESYKKRHRAKDILEAAAKLPKPKKKAA